MVLPVALIAGGVFSTAQVERDAALLGARRAAASERLLMSMLNQETGSRGYFETRDTAFLQPWAAGTGSFASSLAQIRSLVAGDDTLTDMVDDQARLATAWHAGTAAAIATLRRGGGSETVAAALQSKTVMDEFRALNESFDAELADESNASLARATEVAVGVAAALAFALVWLGSLLTRRSSRMEAMRQRDQSELRELLQVSESERESRLLLIRHLEKMLPGSRVAVLNRNHSDDRLEVTLSAASRKSLPD